MSSEIEFKIPMTIETAKSVLAKIFNDNISYMLKIKQDKYWKRPGASTSNINVIRLRSDHFVKDSELAVYDNLVESWFFAEFTNDQLSNLDTSDDERFLTYKNKVVVNNIERNEELEESVSSSMWNVLNRCFNNIGECYFNKVKRCLTFKKCYNDNFTMTIDVCNVNNKYYYFEIEKVINESYISETDINTYTHHMEDYIKNEFGLNPMDKDSRPWMEIIRED